MAEHIYTGTGDNNWKCRRGPAVEGPLRMQGVSGGGPSFLGREHGHGKGAKGPHFLSGSPWLREREGSEGRSGFK